METFKVPSLVELDKKLQIHDLGEAGFVYFETHLDQISELWNSPYNEDLAVYTLAILDVLSLKLGFELVKKYNEIRASSKYEKAMSLVKEQGYGEEE